jgi:hypothetical protein
MGWESFLGYLSLLSFINPELEGAMLARTVAVVHICDAVLCRLIAAHTGRSKTLWAFTGFFLGIWALAILLFVHTVRAPATASPRITRLPR